MKLLVSQFMNLKCYHGSEKTPKVHVRYALIASDQPFTKEARHMIKTKTVIPVTAIASDLHLSSRKTLSTNNPTPGDTKNDTSMHFVHRSIALFDFTF